MVAAAICPPHLMWLSGGSARNREGPGCQGVSCSVAMVLVVQRVRVPSGLSELKKPQLLFCMLHRLPDHNLVIFISVWSFEALPGLALPGLFQSRA